MTLANDLRQFLELSPRIDGESRRQVRPVAELRPPSAQLPIPVPAKPAATRGIEDAMSLLDQATERVAAVLSRNQLLEAYVDQLESRAKAEISDAEASAEEWKARAAEADAKVKDLQRSVEALTARAAEAERDLQHERQLLAQLREKVVTAFGEGSEFQVKIRTAEASGSSLAPGVRETDRLRPDPDFEGRRARLQFPKHAA